MLDILKFIFSSFWIWFGTLILLAVAGDCLTSLIRIMINRK